MAFLRSSVTLGLLLSLRPLYADDPKTPSTPREDGYRRPELVAITWQQTTKPEPDDPLMPLWRPDGSLIGKEEVEWLRDDLTNFNCHWCEPDVELRPLVLVFRIDERAKPGKELRGRVSDGSRPKSIYVAYPNGTAGSSTAHHLAKSAIVPSRAQLRDWPESVDIEVSVPVSEPEVIKSFDRVPADGLKIAEGVRWYIDPGLGQIREKGETRSGFAAAVLEFDSKLVDPLLTVWQEVRLRDGQLLRGGYAKLPEGGNGVAIHVSPPIEDSNPVVSGKFTVIRHRIERYERVPTRLDLKPKMW